jgi:hypothetical protein
MIIVRLRQTEINARFVVVSFTKNVLSGGEEREDPYTMHMSYPCTLQVILSYRREWK